MKVIGHLKEYWFIIIFLGTLVMGWTNVQNDIVSQEARIKALEAQSQKINDNLVQVGLDIAVIKQILIKNYK